MDNYAFGVSPEKIPIFNSGSNDSARRLVGYNYGMNSNGNRLQSRRIILRPVSIQDAREIFSYRSDPGIYEYQSWQPKSLDEVEEFINHRIAGEPDQPDTWFQFAICKTGSGELLGDCGLHFIGEENRQVEFGITLKRNEQGRGYATEALELIFKYVFGDLKKHRIFASVDPNNLASIRLCERMAMRKEGHFRESQWVKDHWADDMVFAMVDREWEERDRKA
jgi:RimJ/RimL family protein N-acetyltransferase